MRLLLKSFAAGLLLACCAMPAAAEQPDPAARRVKNNSDGDGWAAGEAHPWRHMRTGPFFSASIDTGKEPVAKGIVIRLGEKQQASVCFDTELLRMARGWTGGFLEFTARRYGLAAMPRVVGDIRFATPPLPGWSRDEKFPDPRPHKPLGPLPRSHAHYRGLYRHGNRVALAYSVGKADVLESPWVEESNGLTAFTRTLQIGPTEQTQHLLLLKAPQGELKRGEAGEPLTMWSERKGQAAAVAVVGLKGEAALERNAGGQFLLALPASEATRRFKILLWRGPSNKLSAFRSLVAGSPPPEDLTPLTRPGPAQWTAEIATEGKIAADDAPYVVDTLALPFENPYGALFFVSGLDFFSNGDAALCTAHGDVWRVSGIDADLDRITWKRMATGLAQPLGVKIVEEQVYVVGRDQITRLHDGNHDGEADFYENFNNDAEVTTNPHEYVTCLETDAAGNFYFLKGNSGGKSTHDGCLLRVSPDGERLEIFATGFRNANGMSIGPDGTITVAPQEGHWTPSSAIFAVEQGGFYGMMDVHHRSTPPKTFDPPLCWIPHAIDSSSGGQVWITGDRWGPLKGQMLHLSYGRCTMLLVVREKREGQDQAGVVELPLRFASGVTRGCFRPQDGQLYLCGQRGWGTSAAQDGCFQRVRYTGRPVDLPVGMRTPQNGLALTFSRPLDRAAAESLDNYHLERWAYHWTASYGSKDYKISNPKQPGHDPVRLRAARLLDDGRTVFLEIEDFRPAMQMSIDYQLKAADGAAINQSFYCTINGLGKERIETGALAASPRPGELSAATRKNLRPGLRVEFRPLDASAEIQADARVARLAAWYVPAGGSATPFLPPGRFRAAARGYLHADLGGEYRLSLRGRGAATVRVNGQEILRGALQASGERKPSGGLETLPAAAVKLRKGYNRLEIDYRGPPEGDARLRLYWSSDAFPPEPIPPAALSHDRRDPLLAAQAQLRSGRELFATRHCARCHGLPSGVSPAAAMPELSAAPPDLNGVAARLEPAWIAAWLLDPAKLRNHVTMPSLFDDPDAPASRQAAADLAAFLGEGEGEGESGREGKLGIANHSISPSPTLPLPGAAESGEILYENLGCISCHTLARRGAADEFGRTSLHYVAAKFRPGALAAFLAAPHAHYAGSRMPDFQLNADEAANLAAFLRKYAEGEIAPLAELQSADAERGAKLFTTTGCNQCHAIESREPRVESREPNSLARVARRDSAAWLSTLDSRLSTLRGCLADAKETRGDAPDFRLTAEQRAALAAFLKTAGQSLGRTNAAETSLRLMERLRCVACHDRDEKFSRWPEILAIEGVQGLPPELVPDLTWAGEKLRGDWTARLLAGKLDYRARPWLHARMPAFPHYAEILAAGLAAQHGLGPSDLDRPPFDPRLAEIGETLTLKAKGLDCRQCHGLKTITAKQENNAQGISFLHVPQRVRYEYYHRWMLDPLRIDPGTKMPRFSPDHRHTPATAILGGDAHRQYEALWHYLQSIPARTPAPK